MKRKCKLCGESLEGRRSTTVFCNHKCARRFANSNFPPKPVSCKTCEVVFSPMFTRGPKAEFCSSECAYFSYNPHLKCAPKYCVYCGEKLKSKLRSAKFCNSRCCSNAQGKIFVRNLGDSYVAGIIANNEFPRRLVPKDLIEAKRRLLRFKRIIANGDDKTPIGANQRRGK